MTAQDAFGVFLDDRRVNGVTDATVAYYKDTVGRFVSFCDCDLEQTAQSINRYFLSLQDRGLAQNSLLAHWRGLKTFWRFTVEEGYVPSMPKLPKIKEEKKQIKPLALSQVRQVIDSFDTSDFVGLRNQTIIRLMFDSGVRLNELATMTLQDIDFKDQWILVKGKGRKDRWVPFGGSTKRQLWAYLKQRLKYEINGEGALFIKTNGSQLKTRAIQIMFRRLANKISFNGVRLSPHTMRHSFALNWIENGGDPFSLQKILGHSTQTMTSRYVAMAKSTIKAQHNRYSPAERI